MLSFSLPELKHGFIKLDVKNKNDLYESMLNLIRNAIDDNEVDTNLCQELLQSVFKEISIESVTYSINDDASTIDTAVSSALEPGAAETDETVATEAAAAEAQQRPSRKRKRTAEAAPFDASRDTILKSSMIEKNVKIIPTERISMPAVASLQVMLDEFPYHISLYILEFITMDLAERDTGRIQYQKLLGRFRADPERKLQLLYRSLRLNCFVFYDVLLLDQIVRGELWHFVMRNARNLFVYLQEALPFGFDWITANASSSTMPNLQRVSVIDDGIFQYGFQVMPIAFWAMNEYVNHRVVEVQHYHCEDFADAVQRGMFPKLTVFSVYQPPGQHFTANHFEKLKSLRFMEIEVDGKEDVEMVSKLVTNSTLRGFQLTCTCPELDQSWFEWIDKIPRLRGFICCGPPVNPFLPINTWHTPHLKVLSLFDFHVESLDGLEQSKQLETVDLRFADFETANLEKFLELPRLRKFSVEDGNNSGFSPKLRNVVYELVRRGNLVGLTLRLGWRRFEANTFQIRYSDMEALFGDDRSHVNSFELSVRRDRIESDQSPLDGLELTADCLIPMCFNKHLKSVSLDVPGLYISDALVKRVLELNLLESFLTHIRCRNEEI